MRKKQKKVGKYVVRVYENMGRFKVMVEDKDGYETETYVARYEAEERFESLKKEKDCKLFMNGAK